MKKFFGGISGRVDRVCLERDCASKSFNDRVGAERFGTERGRRACGAQEQWHGAGSLFFPGMDMTSKPTDAEDEI
jgi:hypothetical protein